MNLTIIPEEARIQSYIKNKIYIPDGNRCYRSHLIKNRIFEEDLRLLKVYSNTANMTTSKLSKIMEILSLCDSTLFDKIGEYSFSAKQVEIFAELNWENLNTLKDMLISLRNSQSRFVIQALVVFLFKLRTGNSNKMISLSYS